MIWDEFLLVFFGGGDGNDNEMIEIVNIYSDELKCVPQFPRLWLVNLPPPLTYPPQKKRFNEALLRETNG